ncbi:MAG: stage 0 sporulation family protein [Anaerolineales bacterium]
MPNVCGVTFRGNNKVYDFAVDPALNIAVNDYVIVDTARGEELGKVVRAAHEIAPGEAVGELKPVLRLATTADLLSAERYRLQEKEAVNTCRERVVASGLPMKVVGGEYSYDGSHLTFYFTSEERVDFRALVRELARIFKTRIELRQVGVRDEARTVGGVGKCGRPLCCATWLDSFAPVSIRMAKAQNLPLSPNEISGLCGRLLCCLNYEYDYYREVAGRFPKVGKIVESPLGPAKVTYVSVLKETVELLLEDGSRVEMTAEQFKGEEPFERPAVEQPRRHQLAESLEHLNGAPTGSSGATRDATGQNEPPRSAEPRRRGPTVANGAQTPTPQSGAEGGSPRRRSSAARRRSRRRSSPTQPTPEE